MTSPATASNLEQGNILKKMDFSKEAFRVSYGFKNSAKVFWEHLNGIKTKTFLDQLIADFFHYPREKIFLDLVLVEEKDVSKRKFLSMAEKQQQKDQIEREKKRRGLTNHPLIKKAEKIFNSRVDKVILN